MRYLVDTDVISVGAPAKAMHPELVRWMEARSDALVLSSVTVLEIEHGIAKARRERGRARAAALASWLETVLHLYADRILPLDVPVARVAGRLADKARSLGHAPGLPDLAIAATALAHGLTVLSRNVRHFVPLGVPVRNPFETLPP